MLNLYLQPGNGGAKRVTVAYDVNPSVLALGGYERGIIAHSPEQSRHDMLELIRVLAVDVVTYSFRRLSRDNIELHHRVY